MLNLESKPCWKEVGDLWDYHGYCNYTVALNDYIYWKVEDHDRESEEIMGFDIKKEKICSIPYPTSPTYNPCQVRLLTDIDGFLSIVLVRQDEVQVKLDVWSLKNPGRKIWTSSTLVLNSPFNEEYPRIDTVTFFNDMLLFRKKFMGTTLLVWNFKTGTIQELDCDPKDWIVGKFEEEKFSTCTIYFSSHQVSFASLKNCNSVIHVILEVNDDGKLEEERL